MAALTLIVGDEELLVARAVARSLAAAAGADSTDDAVLPSLHEVEAAECSVASLAEILSPSLFAEERLVVLRNAQDADKDLVAALVLFAEAPEPGVAITAVHAGGVKGKAVIEALKAVGVQPHEISRIKTVRDREQFAIDEVRAAGGTLDRDAAADLVGAIGGDLRELATACQQLVADVGGQLSADDVATYYRGRAESTGFAVADRAVEGDLAAALETLRWAFATGLDPILVSSSLAANLRLIAQVGGAGPGSPDSLASKLKLPAWKIRRAQGWLRRWRPEALGDAVRAVAIADADLKGAADDAAYAVERAVHLVAAAASAAA
ncbi:MAG TPA: DNA polymerase III subunit delta [Mycobacteriales bacterium]|jgi:DNA polymerase-3 subunit delta|nr:DNA polymerase III subunit delta [Mycobacteriales bacterium]